MSLNHFVVMGRISRDLEHRVVNNGSQVVAFTIVNNRKYGNSQRTLFIDCELWGNRVDTLMKYFKKGDVILAEGTLDTQKWETKDGQSRSKILLNIRDFHFPLSNKRRNDEEDLDHSGHSGRAAPRDEEPQEKDDDDIYGNGDDDDDIPF